MASSEQTPDITNAKPHQKAFQRTRSVIYYGLAIDSFARPLVRTKRLVTGLSSGFSGMFKSALKGKVFHKAESIEEIVRVHDDCASTMVGTIVVIVFYSFFTFANTTNLYALIVNAVITLAFIFYFIANLFVYLRCQHEMAVHQRNLNKEEMK